MKEKYVCVKKYDVELVDEFLVCECAMNFKIFKFTNEKEYDEFIDWLKKTETDYLST